VLVDDLAIAIAIAVGAVVAVICVVLLGMRNW